MNLTRATTITLLASAGLLVSTLADAQVRGPSRSAPRQAERTAPAPVDEAAAREARLAELEEWLSRLVGQFRYEGHFEQTVLSCSRACERFASRGYLCSDRECKVVHSSRGVGDCVGFGSGPGVHCIISVPWMDPVVVTSPDPSITTGPGAMTIPWPGRIMEPAMILFGIDPDNLGIRYLLVDSKSIAEEALGSLRGDTVTFFTTACVNRSSSCRQIFSIHASTDGRLIRMSLDVRDRRSLSSDRIAGFMFSVYRVSEVPADEVSRRSLEQR